MADNTINAARLLSDLGAMRAAAGGGVRAAAGAGQGERPDFGAVMLQYLSQVNSTQQAASAQAARFEAGARDVQLVDVMVSMQKSRIAFEALTQVRNRLLSAYQDIMNMQV